VRNNALVPWKSIGFLKEATRMNVLLSRARHKLVIVGSWDFFASRCDEYVTKDDEYYYIGQMMRHMQEARKAGKLRRISEEERSR
jgi:superfamily I DNA and/or RNA helicase